MLSSILEMNLGKKMYFEMQSMFLVNKNACKTKNVSKYDKYLISSRGWISNLWILSFGKEFKILESV